MGQTRKEWLQTVTAQLRCRRAVPGVERELENHLSEQYNAFVAQGCAPEEAERRTVESMGDPVLAGGALDRVHRPRPAWGPFFMVAALLLAAEAGVDVVDCAISSMAGMTSQPSLNAVVAAMKDTERDTGLDLDRLQTLTDYWEDVRKRYDSFEGGLEYNTTDIYRYEIPGGQYTNLKPQVESLGLGDRFVEVKENYRKVNEMVGDIVKVTPSSKMVGDLAIFMTQNNLTPENIVEKGESLAFPDSVVSYFSGMMGQPAGGFPKELERVVLKGKKPITCRPGELLPPVDFEEKKREMQSFDADPSWRAILSYCLYPEVVEDYVKNQKEYGYIMRLGSHVFFHGLAVGETNKVNIADGKTLVIKYLGLGEVDKEGMRTVSFELNGIRRDVQVPDEEAQKNIVKVPMADPEDKSQVGSSIPGAVSRLNVKVGDTVEKNQTLVTIEAMKMETAVPARIRRMESRSIHTANGIEVKIPTELLNEESEVEFLHDADGSVSLLIKNVIL